MLDEITWEQFREWMVFSGLSPFTEEREDYRIASIVHAIVNVNRDPKKKRTPYELEEFVLKFGDLEVRKRVQTAEQQKQISKQWFMMFSSGDKNGSRDNSGKNSTH